MLLPAVLELSVVVWALAVPSVKPTARSVNPKDLKVVFIPTVRESNSF